MFAVLTIVSVLYAGSLVGPMEGPVRASLRGQGIDLRGEPGGSRKLANLIAGGLARPDVFISVDPRLVAGLGERVASSTTFASTSIGIGWSDRSRYASAFAAASGPAALLDALQLPGIRIGRTDPRLDPKGDYTLEAMRLLAGEALASKILGDDQNTAQIFPEEDLLARIEIGEQDVGFFYRTEAVARQLHFRALPGKASLRDRITFTIAILRDAPHPDAATRFVNYILHGEGKTILQHAGLDYRAQP